MDIGFDRLRSICLSLIASAFPLLSIFSTSAVLNAVHFILLAALILSAVLLCRQNPLYLVTPFFLMAGMSLCFYALLPWVMFFFPELVIISKVNLLAASPQFSHASTVSRLILAFSALNLGLLIVSLNWIRIDPVQAILPSRRWFIATLACIALLACVYMGSLRLNLLSPAVWGHRQVLDAFPPLISILAATAFVDALSRSKTEAGWVLLFMISIFTILFLAISAFKSGIFLIAAMSILLIATDISWRRLAFIFLFIIVPVIILLGNFDVIRAGNLPRTPDPGVIFKKIGARQIESRFCLGKTLEQVSVNGPQGKSPFYFVGALVPRVLWRDKPDYSSLGVITEKMCFDSVGSSYSMTLLGEPILHSGYKGLAVAAVYYITLQIFMLCVVARTGPVSAAGMLGLAPWLMDFDQFFSLYWANAFKMLIYMSTVLVVLFIMSRRSLLHGPS